jgi:hypothetical protein
VPAPGNGLPQLAEGDEALAEDFAAELARGMESLMREIAAGSGSTSEDAGAGPDEAALKAAWEAMLIEGMDGLSASAPTSPETTSAEGDFQSKIRAAMNKVNEGESTLQDASGAGTCFLSSLLFIFPFKILTLILMFSRRQHRPAPRLPRSPPRTTARPRWRRRSGRSRRGGPPHRRSRARRLPGEHDGRAHEQGGALRPVEGVG